jgi:hypothetical protein
VTLVVDEGDTFSVVAEDRAFLRERLGGRVDAQHGGVSVSRVVGHLRLPSGLTLCIRSPKAPAASVLAWLAFVDPSLRAVDWTDDLPSFGQGGDIAALTAFIFLRQLRRALTRFGVPRVYTSTGTTSSIIRGRIEFQKLTQNRSLRWARLTRCLAVPVADRDSHGPSGWVRLVVSRHFFPLAQRRRHARRHDQVSRCCVLKMFGGHFGQGRIDPARADVPMLA